MSPEQVLHALHDLAGVGPTDGTWEGSARGGGARKRGWNLSRENASGSREAFRTHLAFLKSRMTARNCSYVWGLVRMNRIFTARTYCSASWGGSPLAATAGAILR